MIAAVTMQACLGAAYSWSVFVTPIRDMTAIDQGPAQLPVTSFFVVFPLMTLFAGTLIGRLGPRVCAVIGALCFGSGWMLASLGVHHFAFTVIGIGVLAGIGVGFAYIVPITMAILWFPNNKGLVTGIAVAGFGGGTALVSKLAGLAMISWQYTPFQTFALLGVLFTIFAVAGALFMQNPPGAHAAPRRALPAGVVLSRPTWWLLFISMTVGLSAGLTVAGNLNKFYADATEAVISTAVALFAVGNATGRIAWGQLADRIGGRYAVALNQAAQATMLVLSLVLLRYTWGLYVFSLFAGCNFGGVLVLYAATVARLWPAKRVSQVYGWVFAANIPAAFTPMLAGMAYDRWGSFTLPIMAICVFQVGFALYVWRSTLLATRQERRDLLQRMAIDENAPSAVA